MTKARKETSGLKKFLLFAGVCLVIIAAIAGAVSWQWGPISDWVSDTAAAITHVFGFGLVIVVLVVLTLAVVILSKPSLLWSYWNKWIGSFMLLAAVWGILGLVSGYGELEDYSLGGQIGQSIVSSSLVIGIFIVLLLIITGLFFITPKGFAHTTAGIFSWLFRRFRREQPAVPATVSPSVSVSQVKTGNSAGNPDLKNTAFPRYNPPPKQKPQSPVNGSKSWLWAKLHPHSEENGQGTSTQAISEEKSNSEVPSRDTSVRGDSDAIVTDAEEIRKDGDVQAAIDQAESGTEGVPGAGEKAEKPAEARSSGQSKDVKQAAQEVWKKYGETATEVTADGWKLPPIEILDNTPEVEFSQADNMKKAKLIEDALASYGVEGKVVQINVGPTVTQFGVEPGWDRKLKEVKEKDKNGDVQRKIEEIAKTRVKVDRITSLANDLALALAAPSIRMEAPVPGKSVVGIEVPNTTIGVVSMRSVIESNIFQKMLARAKLSVALGKGAGGESVVGDLTKMPHLLIAGATGSGKTVCIHSIICCLLMHNTPGDVRFIMIDPKRVELTSYNSLPHLATPVIVDNDRAILALRGLTQEMDKRYQTLAAVRARNIEAYNKARPNEKLPYIILIVDELADLMMTAGEEVERTLCRLAQLARAVGIHLIVATQRPSVDVVTGLIKANFPTRISFAVTSQIDSRTILDSGGAEKLLGRGDMLYMPTEAAKPKRIQGCFLSDAEIERVVYFWNNQKKEVASQLKMDDLVAAEEAREEKLPSDPLLEQARKLLKEHEHVSASFLQRHLRIGYPRAARLMEQLEEEMGEDITSEEEDSDTLEEENNSPR